MTSRLIASTGPGGPLPPRHRLLRLAPGRARGRGPPWTPGAPGPPPLPAARHRVAARRAGHRRVQRGRRGTGCSRAEDHPAGADVQRRARHHHRRGAHHRPVSQALVRAPIPTRRSREACAAPAGRRARRGRAGGFLCSRLLRGADHGRAGPDHGGQAARPAAAPAAPRRQASAQAAQLLTQAAQAAVADLLHGRGDRLALGHQRRDRPGLRHLARQRRPDHHPDAGRGHRHSRAGPTCPPTTTASAPEGVLGVTTPLVRLLEAHYIVAYAGPGSV